MTVYFISTPAREDKPAMTCSYTYRQWKELTEYFEKEGIPFKAWKEYIEA